MHTAFLRYNLAITNTLNIKGTMVGVKKNILVSLVNMVGVQLGLCLRSDSLLVSTWRLDLEIGVVTSASGLSPPGSSLCLDGGGQLPFGVDLVLALVLCCGLVFGLA